LHFIFHYVKDLLAPKKRKDVISYEINKYKDIVENLINQKGSKPVLSKEDELLEEALESLKNWDENDDTVSVVDYQSMEQDLTEYALKQI
jgi:hypothetical protein